MLHDTEYSIDFSVDYDGNWEDIDIMEEDQENITEQEIIDLLKKVVDNRKLILGERSTGEIEVKNGEIIFNYKYCTELGEDWNDDVWIEDSFTIPND